MAPKYPPRPPWDTDGWGRSIGPKTPPRIIPHGQPEWWTKDGTASKESRTSAGRRLWETNPAPYNSRKGSDSLKKRRNKGLYDTLTRRDEERTRGVLDELFKERPPLTRTDSKAPGRKERLPEPNKATPDEQRRRLESFGTGENMPKPTPAPKPGDVLRRRRNPQGDTRGTDRASRPRYRRV